MSPHLIINAAVLCGFWTRRFRCIMNNYTDPSKVDNTSDDSSEKQDGEIPISLNHGDRLADLPDEILSCILTHLTLRDVVRMTTLSKRWKNIWLSLSKLDLEWRVTSGHKGCSHVDLREIELGAKSLNFFDFVGRATVKFSFLSASKLKISHVALTDNNYKGAECIIRDLATIPSLETLLLEDPDSLLHLIPTHPSSLFRRVVRLSLIFMSEDPEVDMVKSFPRLLNSFPQLQKLYLMVPHSFSRTYELLDVCLNTSIKEVELGNFQMDWIPCASYFLKSTLALDRMLISRHITKYTREGEWKRNDAHSFSQQECDYIRFALQGNAISPNADLVIQ